MEKLKVLTVDDSETARQAVTLMLDRLGHDSLAAEGGEEALALLEKEAFDLIICDLVMPGLDGLATLKAIRARKIQTPFLMATAHGSMDTAVEALRSGADDYLTKPLSLQLLEHRIKSVLERRRLQEAQAERNRLRGALAMAGAAAHELNQPLAALMAATELMKLTGEPEKIRKLAGQIFEETARLGKITRRLTQVTRYQTKKYLGLTEIIDLDSATRPENTPEEK